MKIGIIVQARLGSTRLYKKCLLPIKGKPSLLHLIERLKQVKNNDKIIIATTQNPIDDELEKFCIDNNILYFRGNENDVLSRYYHCSKGYKLDTIVRITGDCPVIDYDIIDECIQKLLDENRDYVSNIEDRTFIHGLDTEVFTFDALQQAYEEAEDINIREHVTLYIRTNPDKFDIGTISAVGKFNRPDIRATVDTYEDYLFMQSLYDELYDKDNLFKSEKIIDLLDQKPYLLYINKDINQKRQFSGPNKETLEMIEGIRFLLLQDLFVPAQYLAEHLSTKNKKINLSDKFSLDNKNRIIKQIRKLMKSYE